MPIGPKRGPGRPHGVRVVTGPKRAQDMTKLTKTEEDAIRYLKKVGSVWTLTATDDFCEVLARLEAKGRVKFVPRPNSQGIDAFPVEDEA